MIVKKLNKDRDWNESLIKCWKFCNKLKKKDQLYIDGIGSSSYLGELRTVLRVYSTIDLRHNIYYPVLRTINSRFEIIHMDIKTQKDLDNIVFVRRNDRYLNNIK